MIPRPIDQQRLDDRLATAPVVLLVGPRQSGKTTLARQLVAPASENYFDLENPIDLARLDQPMTALGDLSGLVVIDEVQLRPDLFGVLRVLVDRDDAPSRFLVLGSAQPAALRQASESLAGRVAVVEIGGFRFSDTGAGSIDAHWLRGSFPRAQLADDDDTAATWNADYLRSLIDGDLIRSGGRLSSTALRRLLAMVGHSTGQVWNNAEPARALGISQPTVRSYLDLATDALLVRQLQPFTANLKKRQVRSPKVYVRDTGLAHSLLGIRTRDDLAHHSAAGATWEGLIIEEVLRVLDPPESYFWATHGGAELDLYVPGARAIGIEVRRADAPTITRSMRTATADLRLHHLVVVYPGDRAYRLSDEIVAVPAATLADQRAAVRVLTTGDITALS